MSEIHFQVTDKRVIITDKPDIITSGNVEYIRCVFELSEAFDGLIARASFNGVYRPITNGECYAPILDKGTCKIGVYGCTIENDEYKLVVSPNPAEISVREGSFNPDDVADADIPSSEVEALEQAINAKLDKNQGVANAGKYMKVGSDGNLVPAEGGGSSSIRPQLDLTNGKTWGEINNGTYDISGAGNLILNTSVTLPLPVGTIVSKQGNAFAAMGYGLLVHTDDVTNLTDISKAVVVNTAVASFLQAAIDGKQNELTAGAGISIVENVISATLGVTFEVVQMLPQTGVEQTIYLVPNSGSGTNVYDEYIWVNNAFEKIGSTDIDLSNYVTNTTLATALNDYATLTALTNGLDLKADASSTYTKTEVDTALAGKQDTLTAGDGISISSSNVISATGGGGSSVDVEQTTGQSTTAVMSQKAVTDELADKQDTMGAGTGIVINNNVISLQEYSGTASDVTVKLGQEEICQYFGIKNDGVAYATSGVLVSRYGCSSYIDCLSADSITIKRPREGTSSGFGLAFYDGNKTFMSFVANPTGNIGPVVETILVPNGAYYFRTTHYSYERAKELTDAEFECTITYKNGYLSNGKRPYQNEPIFFSPIVNNGIANYQDTSNASVINVNYKETTSVLWLPSSYKPNGKPTKMIILFHGQAQTVYYGVIGATDNYLKNKIKQYVDAGFAVLLCGGIRNNSKSPSFPSFGLPQGNEAYFKSYEYATEHYNIDSNVYAIGLSMGGLAAIGFTRSHQNIVSGLILCSIWGSLYECVWDNHVGGNWTGIINEYMGTTTYTDEKFRGIAPEIDKITIDNVDYIRPFTCPVLALSGGAESGQIIDTHNAYVTGLQNTGSDIQSRSVNTLTHLDMTRNATPVIDNDIINWCKAH